MKNNFSLGHDGVGVVDLPEKPFGAPPDKIEKITFHRFSAEPERLIYVKSSFQSGKDNGNLLAFSETDAAQPNGAAFVAGSSPVQVALTKGVADALNAGQILECSSLEFANAEAAKREKVLSTIERKKAAYRMRFIDLVGNDDLFEQAWISIQAREALNSLMGAG